MQVESTKKGPLGTCYTGTESGGSSSGVEGNAHIKKEYTAKV